MSSVDGTAAVAAARAGDETAFGELVERHRRELRVHCYRMVGSLDESEDLVQETFLRAWRSRETFQGRSTFRAWLYRIATNACLDQLARRPRRVLPHEVAPAADPDDTPPAHTDAAWLEPYPDRLLDGLENVAASQDGPDTAVLAKETIELAFLAAIQHLPPRQRAVLLLRDVLGWPAGDTATVLEMTVPAANSALQRARATMKEHLPARRVDWAPTSEPSAEERALLRRYVDAQQSGDGAALVELLRADVRVSFPPKALWYDGRDAFVAGARKHAAVGEYRFVPTWANRQPAAAIYLRRPGERAFRPLVLEVLRVEGGQIAEIIDYDLPGLFAAFGLPETLEPDSAT